MYGCMSPYLICGMPLDQQGFAAGIKVSCIVSAVADGVKSVKIFPERTSEIKTLRIGFWVKDRILLIDPWVL